MFRLCYLELFFELSVLNLGGLVAGVTVHMCVTRKALVLFVELLGSYLGSDLRQPPIKDSSNTVVLCCKERCIQN